MLENTLFDLRSAALAEVPKAAFVSTVDAYSTIRVLANLRPESTEAIFSSTHHTQQAADLKAFDAGIGDTGQSAGFGPNTTMTGKHTNLRQKRKPNDSALAHIKGIVFECLGVKVPKTTTNSSTISDDSDDAQYVAPDAVGFARDHIAKLVACDYAPYVQKTGSQKELLGPLRWEATESGVLFAFFAFPEGYTWGGSGQGSEMVVGLERQHLTYNKEWVADTDRPWEDIADGLGIAFTAAQPAAATVLANLDICVRLVGAQAAGIRG